MKDLNSISLIHKSLTGQITPEENSQLQEWLNASPHNQSEYMEIKVLMEISIEEELLSSEDSAQSLERLETSINESIRKETAANRIRKTGLIFFYLGVLIITSALASLLFYREMPRDYSYTISKSGDRLTLPDGSGVILNDSTTITHTLTTASRTINLEGEAFFNIKKDPRPLTLITWQCNINVKGTSFYLSAYKGKTIELLVTQGLVEVSFKDKTWSLTRNQFLTLKDDVHSQPALDANPNFTAWQTNRLQFKQSLLADVIVQLEKYYDVKIDLQQNLLDCSFTGTFENLSLMEVFNILSYGLDLEFKPASNNHYFVSGPGCTP